MPKLTYQGVGEFGLILEKINDGYDAYVKAGMYDANTIIYDEVKTNIENVPTQGKRWQGTGYHLEKEHWKPHGYLTEWQKAGLLESLYGSKFFKENSTIYFVISVTGYNSIVTKKFKNGQPNIEILRSLEHGTSYLIKQPVMRKALNKVKKRAIQQFEETVKNEVAKLQKE